MSETFIDRVCRCRIIDGDSQELSIDLGYSLRIEIRTRLAGVDAPEKSTAAGQLVRQMCEQWVAARTANLVWHSISLDKFGRSLGDLVGDGQALAEYLLRHGLARSYDGGRRSPWLLSDLQQISERCRELLK